MPSIKRTRYKTYDHALCQSALLIRPASPLARRPNSCRVFARLLAKKPLLVRGAFSGLAGLLEPEELLELAETDDVESRLIIENSEPAWEVREGPFHATTWRKLPDTGWTALVQAVDHYLPPLADLLDHFAFVPEWRIDDVMVSYAVPGGSVGITDCP